MNRAAYLLLLLSGLFWGVGFPLGKIALRETDAVHVILLRFAVAAVVALPFALRTPQARALFRSPWVLAAGALYGVAFIVQFEGLVHVSVTLAALLVGLMPALIAVCARLMGEHVSRVSWVGVAAATLGAALIAGKPDAGSSVFGVVLSLIALLVFLAWLVVLRRAPTAPGVMAMPAVTIVVAAIAIAPIALVMHGPPNLALSATAWAGIAGQGVFSTLLATACWQIGSARVGSAAAGVFINIEPLMGAAIGILLFGDQLTAAVIVGGALIMAGSLGVVLGEKSAPPAIAPNPPTPA